MAAQMERRVCVCSRTIYSEAEQQNGVWEMRRLIEITGTWHLPCPGGTSQLGLPYAQQAVSLEPFVDDRFRSWHFKNLKMANAE